MAFEVLLPLEVNIVWPPCPGSVEIITSHSFSISSILLRSWPRRLAAFTVSMLRLLMLTFPFGLEVFVCPLLGLS